MGFLESLKKLFGMKDEEKKVETANQNPTTPNTGNDTTGQNQGTL
jgi:hypothetical protein